VVFAPGVPDVRGSVCIHRRGQRFLYRPDPSDDDSYQDPGGIETEWVVASLLFLSGVAAYSGPSSSMITRARQREPEIAGLMRTADDTALRQMTLRDALIPVWPQIQEAARERRKRSGRDSPR
jgi:hypothetical protein